MFIIINLYLLIADLLGMFEGLSHDLLIAKLTGCNSLFLFGLVKKKVEIKNKLLI